MDIFFSSLGPCWRQDSDDDGSVHLGEVLASQTAARAPPGGPANAVPGETSTAVRVSWEKELLLDESLLIAFLWGGVVGMIMRYCDDGLDLMFISLRGVGRYGASHW